MACRGVSFPQTRLAGNKECRRARRASCAEGGYLREQNWAVRGRRLRTVGDRWRYKTELKIRAKAPPGCGDRR